MSVEHAYYPPRPIVSRPRLAWPNGAALAVAIVVSVEYYEMQPPEGAFLPPNLPGGFGRGPYPDFRSFSLREFGNRVGIFRVMEILDRHGLKATAAIDARTATERPVIVDACRRRGWGIAAHGLAVTRVISSRMPEAEERAYIAESIDAVRRACGSAPAGWHGPEYGESTRTPALLAEAGIKYVLDWPNDDQPLVMQTPSGPLVSVPMAIDLDDVVAHWHRKITMARWRQAVADAVDRLLAEGRSNARLLVLNLHPWLIGQPYRATYLDEALADLKRRDGLWLAITDEIAATVSL
jgi:allantoinase